MTKLTIKPKPKECTSEEYWQFYNKPTLNVKAAATLLLGLNPDSGIPQFKDFANDFEFDQVYETLRYAVDSSKELKTTDELRFSVKSEIETKSFFEWAFYKEKNHNKRFPKFVSQLPKKIVSKLNFSTYTLSIPIRQHIYEPIPESREQLVWAFLRLSEEVQELKIENNKLKPLAQKMQKRMDEGKKAGKKSGEARRTK